MKHLRSALARAGLARWVLAGVLAWGVWIGEGRMEGAPTPRVVVVGVDGMTSEGLRQAAAPRLRQMMRRGAFSWNMRAVMPTSSSPNWASMIMGAGPEQHGITSNDWQTNKFEIAPTAVGPGGFFPTVFSVVRQQRPRANLAAFYDWGDFGRLIESGMMNRMEDCDGPTNTIEHAVAYLRECRPGFVFLQLDHVDHAGHQYGYDTPEYRAAIEVADRLVGRLLEALNECRLEKETVVFVVSDHGGVKKGHGGATMSELIVPFVVAVPGIARNQEIVESTNIYDLAPTLAAIFRAKPPQAWIAKPIVGVFEAKRAGKP